MRIKQTSTVLLAGILSSILSACNLPTSSNNKQPGVNNHTIRLGSVLALQGQTEALGDQIKAGLEAALKGEKVQGRTITISFRNDFYPKPVLLQ